MSTTSTRRQPPAAAVAGTLSRGWTTWDGLPCRAAPTTSVKSIPTGTTNPPRRDGDDLRSSGAPEPAVLDGQRDQLVTSQPAGSTVDAKTASSAASGSYATNPYAVVRPLLVFVWTALERPFSPHLIPKNLRNVQRDPTSPNTSSQVRGHFHQLPIVGHSCENRPRPTGRPPPFEASDLQKRLPEDGVDRRPWCGSESGQRISGLRLEASGFSSVRRGAAPRDPQAAVAGHRRVSDTVGRVWAPGRMSTTPQGGSCLEPEGGFTPTNPEARVHRRSPEDAQCASTAR